MYLTSEMQAIISYNYLLFLQIILETIKDS